MVEAVALLVVVEEAGAAGVAAFGGGEGCIRGKMQCIGSDRAGYTASEVIDYLIGKGVVGSVGAQPVTVQAAEVSQAFATGVVESMMSSGSTGWDAKLHEHVKYWYDTQAWLPKNAVIVNKAAFDALDAPTKAAVMKAAADAEARGLAASKKANTESLDKLKAGGMQILPPSAALKADMKKVGDTMLKEWLDKAGPEGKALIDAYKK